VEVSADNYYYDDDDDDDDDVARRYYTWKGMGSVDLARQRGWGAN
jgi:hypothetical protein